MSGKENARRNDTFRSEAKRLVLELANAAGLEEEVYLYAREIKDCEIYTTKHFVEDMGTLGFHAREVKTHDRNTTQLLENITNKYGIDPAEHGADRWKRGEQ